MKRLRIRGAWPCSSSLAAAMLAASVLAAGGATARTASAPDARDRQLVHDQDVRPGAGVRPDRVDDRPRDLRHPLHLQGRQPRRSRSRCSSRRWTASKNAETFTFQLKKNVHFADGTPLTSADVVWSLKRLVNLAGNPAFLLPGVSISAAGPYTVVMHSDDARHRAAGDPREPVDRHPQLEARDRARRHRRRRTRPRPTRPRTGSTRSASVGAGSGPYTLSCLQRHLADHARAEHELLGRRRSPGSRASSFAT